MTRRKQNAEDVIGAIRLALEGATDDATAVRVTKALVAEAPATEGNAVAPVSLLLSTVRRLKGKFAVAGRAA